jgi:Protein of unknown function (DUF2795)
MSLSPVDLQKNGAPGEILGALSQLDESDYESPAAVSAAVSTSA